MSDATVKSEPAARSGKRSLVIVLVLFTLIIAACGWVAFIWWKHPDGIVTWDRLLLRRPEDKLVKVTGRIMYQGKPVTVGSVVTLYENRELFGGLSVLDQEGQFELNTQIDGKYHPGAYVGEHVVAVFSYEESNSPGQPPGLVPQKYLMHSTSPLRIQVTADPEKNVFEFELEGELSRRRQGPPAENEEIDEPKPADEEKAAEPADSQ